VPVKGPRITCGSSPTNEAVARTVAEPVVWVSHQMTAKETNWLPKREKAWPVQMVKKRGAQGLVFSKAVLAFIVDSFLKILIHFYIIHNYYNMSINNIDFPFSIIQLF
jgi:hypothetical protein